MGDVSRSGASPWQTRLTYILLLNIMLSEKIALPTTKPTIAIIGKLIVAPAIPADIPMSADRPKANRMITAAYQPGYVPYSTDAWHPVHTWTPFWLSL